MISKFSLSKHPVMKIDDQKSTGFSIRQLRGFISNMIPMKILITLNSLMPGRCGCSFDFVIYKHIVVTGDFPFYIVLNSLVQNQIW